MRQIIYHLVQDKGIEHNVRVIEKGGIKQDQGIVGKVRR